jgi:hypothetical protein
MAWHLLQVEYEVKSSCDKVPASVGEASATTSPQAKTNVNMRNMAMILTVYPFWNPP